jgi:hypothetical protein
VCRKKMMLTKSEAGTLTLFGTLVHFGTLIHFGTLVHFGMRIYPFQARALFLFERVPFFLFKRVPFSFSSSFSPVWSQSATSPFQPIGTPHPPPLDQSSTIPHPLLHQIISTPFPPPLIQWPPPLTPPSFQP